MRLNPYNPRSNSGEDGMRKHHDLRMPPSQCRGPQDINPPPSTFGFFPLEEPAEDLDPAPEPSSDSGSEEGFEGYEGKTILEMSQPQFPLLSELTRANPPRQPDVVGLSTPTPYMGYTSPYHNQPMLPGNGADSQPQQQHHPDYTQQYPGRAVAIDPGLIAAAVNAINDTGLKMTNLELATNELNKSLSTTSDCLNHLHVALKGDLIPAAAPPGHVPPPATLNTSLAITADHLNNLRAVLSGWQHQPMAPPAAFDHHQAPPPPTMPHPVFPAPTNPRKRDFSTMNTTTSFAAERNNNPSAPNATTTTPLPPPTGPTTTTPAPFPPTKHLSNPLLPAPPPHVPPPSTATPWSEQEKQWLRDQATRYKHVRPRPSNRQLVREFNEFWVGKQVLGGHGTKKGPVLSRPRAPRSERAVETVVRRYGLWEGITLDNDSHRRRVRRGMEAEGRGEGGAGEGDDEGDGEGVGEEEDAEGETNEAEGFEAEGWGADEM
ncbi:hypothetical protein SLS55_009980 [Diplodia seriata]|uniref:Myb-like domain-containing protein n=1 Tax=Diplodia seriata TaxID=420778 RepID=A0ABR3C1K8_9PEZI